MTIQRGRTTLRRGWIVAATLALLLPPLPHAGPPTTGAPAATPSANASAKLAAPSAPRVADFGDPQAPGYAPPSDDAREIADWIAGSGDNAGTPFVIVDKVQARLHVFDAGATRLGSTPVLLGSARGDDSVPGIGLRAIADVRPAERTTPAGRFVARPGRNAAGEDVIWVDHGAAVSMHRVRATVAAERRLERLATPSVEDNRISYGCINVPAAFYDASVRPAFAQGPGIVYVLPEHRSVRREFRADDDAQATGRRPPAYARLTPAPITPQDTR